LHLTLENALKRSKMENTENQQVSDAVSPWRLSVAPMMDWTLCSGFMRAAAVLVANL